MNARTLPLALLALAACRPPAGSGHAPPPRPSGPVAVGAVDPKDGLRIAAAVLPMPAGDHPLHTDYVVYDQPTHAVWIPVGTFGRVDVFDTAARTFTSIGDYPTTTLQVPGGRRILGPSSSTVGEGVVWVGNRSDRRICAQDLRTHQRGACVTLEQMPDGVTYVPSRHELWVTAPRANSLIVVSVPTGGTPTVAATIRLEGEPEGYAVDPVRGWFFTNLKDRDRTVAFDLNTRQQVASWQPHCGEGAARGLYVDEARRWLFVSCDDHVVNLDMAHDGATLGSVPTGDGVDDMGYWPARHLLYCASSADGVLRFVHVSDAGALGVVAFAVTGESARNAVVDEHGRAYVVDSLESRLYVVEPPPANLPTPAPPAAGAAH